MIRRPPRSTRPFSSAASDVYKRQFYYWYTHQVVLTSSIYFVNLVLNVCPPFQALSFWTTCRVCVTLFIPIIVWLNRTRTVPTEMMSKTISSHPDGCNSLTGRERKTKGVTHKLRGSREPLFMVIVLKVILFLLYIIFITILLNSEAFAHAFVLSPIFIIGLWIFCFTWWAHLVELSVVGWKVLSNSTHTRKCWSVGKQPSKVSKTIQLANGDQFTKGHPKLANTDQLANSHPKLALKPQLEYRTVLPSKKWPIPGSH